MEKYKIELIHWVDSALSINGWGVLEEISCEVQQMFSVGYVTTETETDILVVPHLSPENDNSKCAAAGWITIPKCSIKWRKVLGEGKGGECD